MALERPSDFVLKPQREGGGNNLFGYEMVSMLTNSSIDQLSSYILMDIIKPVSQKNILVKDGQIVECEVLNELGIYGTFLKNKSEMELNRASGYLLRTKSEGTLEGGVASGFSCLDSLDLIP